jgi:hypothetical protein
MRLILQIWSRSGPVQSSVPAACMAVIASVAWLSHADGQVHAAVDACGICRFPICSVMCVSSITFSCMATKWP